MLNTQAKVNDDYINLLKKKEVVAGAKKSSSDDRKKVFNEDKDDDLDEFIISSDNSFAEKHEKAMPETDEDKFKKDNFTNIFT